MDMVPGTVAPPPPDGEASIVSVTCDDRAPKGIPLERLESAAHHCKALKTLLGTEKHLL